jgi:hypothetical protein
MSRRPFKYEKTTNVLESPQSFEPMYLSIIYGFFRPSLTSSSIRLSVLEFQEMNGNGRANPDEDKCDGSVDISIIVKARVVQSNRRARFLALLLTARKWR